MSKCKEHIIITIGRTFGSGAREIGKKVADELEIPFYDKALLEIAARGDEFGFESLNWFEEKLSSYPLCSSAFNSYTGNIESQNILIKAIESVANQGSCVIVGRCADRILRNKHDTLSIFISAPFEKRIARVSKRDGLTEKDSEIKMLKADTDRCSYYNYHGEGKWGEAANYNLCIDSSDLGIDNSAAVIIQYLKLKGKLI